MSRQRYSPLPGPPLQTTYKLSNAHSNPCAPGHLLAVDLDVEVLNLGFVVAADGRRSDSAESEVALIADDQPAFRIASHVDPRAKFFFRDREQLLDLKAGQQIEQVTLSASGVAAVRVHKILSARMSFQFGDDLGLGPLLGVAFLGDLPRIVRHEETILAIAAEQRDLRTKPRAPP